MNRELLLPISIGAIIICFIMAFSFYMLVTPFILLAISIFILYQFKQNIYLKYFVVISFSVVLGLLSVARVHLDNRSNFLPLKFRKHYKGDITVSKDSSPVKGGYITSGIIYKTYNNQLIVNSKYPVTIFSGVELFSGDILKNEKLMINNELITVNTKIKQIQNSSSELSLLRKKILLNIKSRAKSPLLIALITGNKSLLDSYIIDNFRRSGCSHILALSGFHVGIIVLIFLLISRLLFTGDKIYIISFIALVSYVLLVGISPSLIRSIIMYLILVIFKINKKKLSVYLILLYTFYIIILFRPQDFYTLSFKLSFLALLGIVTIGKDISFIKCFKKLPRIISSSLSASIGAMILTSFICIPTFGVIYPISILSSLILTPLITLFIWLGLLSMLIPPLHVLVLLLENILYFLVELFSKFPSISDSLDNYHIMTLIFIFIPVILLSTKIHRRLNAGRFNIKFKL